MSVFVSMTEEQVTLWWCHYLIAKDDLAEPRNKAEVARLGGWLQAIMAAMAEAENDSSGVEFDLTADEVAKIRERGAAADRRFSRYAEAGSKAGMQRAANWMLKLLGAIFAGAPAALEPTGNETDKP